MSQTAKKSDRARQAELASHYRAIGPAAVAAALLHTPKKKKPVQKIVSPRVS